MVKSTHRGAVVLGLALSVGFGCAGITHRTTYQYFEKPAPHDAWSRKIERWQAREEADHPRDDLPTKPVAGAGADSRVSEMASDLREKYDAFRQDQKRDLARGVAEWIQEQSREHYVVDGPIDHWATFQETFRNNGDDCDGLELLVFHMLQDLGFSDDEVFRAIVFRRNDGQHHMVTLWFEDANDPWVIDPTGAMTSGMPRMSEVPGWVPLKVFSEDED